MAVVTGDGADAVNPTCEAGESLIVILNADGTGTFALVSSSIDGDFARATDTTINANGRAAEVQYLHNVSAGEHTLTADWSGGSSERFYWFRVTGLANADAEDGATSSNASGTSHPCGALTASLAGFACGSIRVAGSKGTVGATDSFTAVEFGSRSLGVYRAVPSGGAYNPTGTTSLASASEAAGAFFADVGGGGGGNAALLHMTRIAHLIG